MNKNCYITNYLLSLSERSYRRNNGDFQIGFDWIIYKYGLIKNWQPVRYPFNIEPSGNVVSHKTEAEYGIDLNFYDVETNTIIVFLLKADRLNYKNWTEKNFDYDLRRAVNPNFSDIEIDINSIKTYKIITVYNKNDDKKGVECYENFVSSSNTFIYNNINVEFERWNIDRLTKEVNDNLLTADVLPNNLSGLFSYISLQVADFEYGTKKWENQLIPNWNNFLDQVFITGIDERKLNLIPFSLIILKGAFKNCNSAKIGWIDLIEYSMIKLWDLYPKLSRKLKSIVTSIWLDFYINELIIYFNENEKILTLAYGLAIRTACLSVNVVSTAYVVFWHIARLGILFLSFWDIQDEIIRNKYIDYCSNYLKRFIDSNPNSYYPLIDINHIELYLIFVILLVSKNTNYLYNYFTTLGNFLCVRKANKVRVPFIESHNRIDLVAEYVATDEIPLEWSSKSSYLLTMLLEMFIVFDKERAVKLINYYFNEIINSPNKDINDSIDLVSWYPDEDWYESVFKNLDNYGGTGISTSNFVDFNHGKESIIDIIKQFMFEARSRDIDLSEIKRPISAYLLASLKNQIPLPPEFWRVFILGSKLQQKS